MVPFHVLTVLYNIIPCYKYCDAHFHIILKDTLCMICLVRKCNVCMFLGMLEFAFLTSLSAGTRTCTSLWHCFSQKSPSRPYHWICPNECLLANVLYILPVARRLAWIIGSSVMRVILFVPSPYQNWPTKGFWHEQGAMQGTVDVHSFGAPDRSSQFFRDYFLKIVMSSAFILSILTPLSEFNLALCPFHSDSLRSTRVVICVTKTTLLVRAQTHNYTSFNITTLDVLGLSAEYQSRNTMNNK